jgi:nucleolar protein 12
MAKTAVSSLASLFSDESKANYQRVNKPKEVVRQKRVRQENDENDDGEENYEIATAVTPKKVKKPKHKHRKQETTDATPSASPVEGSNSEAAEGPEGREKDERTIFVGNIPITETVTSLRTFFSQFGQVESARLRSVPIAGTAVNDHGNQGLVKKVCVNQSKFGDQKGSFNAYVVFKSKASVQPSLAANNRLMGTRHLRVDSLNPTLFSPKTSVFLGGLPFYTDEEELREHFAKVRSVNLLLLSLMPQQLLPNGQDDIVGIRLIRDQETLVGKGIGYLALRNHEAVMKALQLDKVESTTFPPSQPSD